jgi:dTDP-4-dehydrorhamnose reductase
MSGLHPDPGSRRRSIVITGAAGYVGTYLSARLAAAPSTEVHLLADDITRPDLRVPPADVVIHLAGKLNSFRGSEAEIERHNYDGTVNLAMRCDPDAHFVFLSTDQVFSSDLDRVYTEDDAAAPETVYGRTKARAEAFLLSALPHVTVLRTSVVYGYAHPRRQNTVAFIESRLRVGQPIELYEDVLTSPTYIGDLCACIELALAEGALGVRHSCGVEYLSRCDIGRAICRARGYPESLIRPAARPETMNIPRFIHLRPSDVFSGLLTTTLEEGLRASPVAVNHTASPNG